MRCLKMKSPKLKQKPFRAFTKTYCRLIETNITKIVKIAILFLKNKCYKEYNNETMLLYNQYNIVSKTETFLCTKL